MACGNREIVHSRVERSGEAPGSGADSLLRRCGAVLGTWTARARQRRALRELDDRLLDDVGLTRADVRHEGAKPFWLAGGRTEPSRFFPGRRRLAAALLLITGR
jgi:uncharacterized protein YjiS (DUF1127 family)